MSTPNLGITLLVDAQASKATTVNNALDALDEAIAGVFTQAMADADQTPTAAQAAQCAVIKCTGADTADRHLILPQATKLYVIHNLTTGGHNIIVKTAAGGSPATVTVANGAIQLVYCDGSNFYAAA